jgi:cysteine desulfurase/selenocysteine lyase
MDATPITGAEVDRLREDFPALRESVNGHPLRYLDSAATALRPTPVLEAERSFSEHGSAAVHRGAHALAAEATELFEDARARVARFIGAGADEIVWTGNATASLNLVAYALSNASIRRPGTRPHPLGLGEGDEIVVTELEHHANLLPWQELAARTGATLRHIGIDDDGRLRMAEAAAVIGDRTRVLAVSAASNVLGSMPPVHELAALARRVGALVVLDASQWVPHLPLDVGGSNGEGSNGGGPGGGDSDGRSLDVDFAAFSGHKMLGPTGIGVLYGRHDLLDALPPFLTGGSMIAHVTMHDAEYLPAPARFEAGTPPVAQAIGLAAAVDYLDRLGMERVAERDARLGQVLASGLAGIPGVRLLGPAPGEPRLGLASFEVDGVHPHDVAQYLDSLGIAVRAGHHCAEPLHRRLGLTGSTRASTYLYTTDEEIDAFLNAVGDVRGYFRR